MYGYILRIKGPTNQRREPWWSSGLSADYCSGVDAMLAAAQLWPNNTVIYGSQSFPNSNTVAHMFGVIGGVQPTRAPTLVGLESIDG